jgi:hypothetical protein
MTLPKVIPWLAWVEVGVLVGRLVDVDVGGGVVDSFVNSSEHTITRSMIATPVPVSTPTRAEVGGCDGFGVRISGVFAGVVLVAVSDGAGARVCDALRGCSVGRSSDRFVHGVLA